MLTVCFCLAARGLSVTGFSPASGQPGNVITVTGSGFNGATAVEFNPNDPTLADFTNVSDTQLQVVAPQGATSGPLEVFAGGAGAASAASFLVAPVISDFYPPSGASPTMVFIFGANFVSNGTTVIFSGATNRISATFLAHSAGGDEVEATVPPGAGNGPITVITSAGTNVSVTNFLASSLPTITSFSPAAGTNGQTVYIYGGNFFSGTTVKFGARQAAVYIASTAEIEATVPAGASATNITVINSYGSFTTSSNFLTGTGPVVTDFNPGLGAVGSYVTIDGLNFTPSATVAFNGKSETVTGYSGSTQLQVYLGTATGTGPVTVTTAAGSFTTSTNFTNTDAPFITDFYPALGPAGSSVTIDGVNFTGITSVKFGGAGASFSAVGATQISATVPSVSTGNYALEVISSAGSSITGSNFTVTGTAPVIVSFTPASGVRGTSVTLNGANFSGVSSVKFGGVAASFQPPTTTTELSATVPANAATGLITAANASGAGASAALFYLQPWITSLSTNGGIVNASFTLTGRNLTNATSVQVNGINYNFTGAASQIVAAIPSNATSGQIEITAPGGVFISPGTFAILPKIYGFSPGIGPAGTVVTISGTSLFDVTSVEFNGLSAPVSSAATNQVKVVVPAGAGSGPLTVVTPYGNDTSSNSLTVTKPSTVVLTKTASPMVAAPGSNVTYTLLVTNQGPSIITSAVVTDTLPAGFTFVSATTAEGSWLLSNNELTWSIGLLTNGHSASLQIVGASPSVAALTNSAVLAFAEGNLAPYDNYSSIVNYFVNDSQRTLAIRRQGNPPGVLVTWPLSPAPFPLQINTNPNLNTGWAYLTNAVFISNGLNSFTDSFTAPQMFFRLAPP